MNIPSKDGVEAGGRVRAWRQPGRLSTTVISEVVEEESREEETPADPGTEEANVGFHQNPSTQSEVAELREQLNEDISELNSKLTRVESQLSVLIRLMQNQTKPELQARHAHSFPTPTTSSSPAFSYDSPQDVSVASSARQDAENTSSPSWLSPPPTRSSRSLSDPNNGKSSSKRDRKDQAKSPAINLARHGRRKISDA